MKCPTCNAWTNVRESRPINGKVKRRRECANLHRFTTYETETNHEGLNVLTGRAVFNWMRKLLSGETRNVVQPRQGDLFEGKKKQNLPTEEVLNNIMDSLRSKNEKR
jgi:transcriptional regulator NrdR family protein